MEKLSIKNLMTGTEAYIKLAKSINGTDQDQKQIKKLEEIEKKYKLPGEITGPVWSYTVGGRPKQTFLGILAEKLNETTKQLLEWGKPDDMQNALKTLACVYAVYYHYIK